MAFGKSKYKKITPVKPIEFEDEADDIKEEVKQPIRRETVEDESESEEHSPTDEELLDTLEGTIVRITAQSQRAIQIIQAVRARLD